MTPHTPALDGVRGIAILLVLFHHFTIFDPVTSVGAWLGFFALLGWCGVDIFFVLSGFLITGILIDARGSNRYFASFYARRVLRIFPLYYLVVFISFIVLPQFPRMYDVLVGAGEFPQWPYWLYLVNFAIAERGAFGHGVLDVAWSLAIEEQFYLVWPALVWLMPLRLLGPLCAVIVLVVPWLRTIALSGGFEPVDVYVLPHLRADALALGALLAWLSRRGLLERIRRSGPILAVGGAGAAAWCAFLAGSPWWYEPLMQRVGYSMFALAGAGLVIAAATGRDGGLWQRGLRMGWLRAFGKYSYAMYLIHLPVSRTVQEFLIDPEEAPTLLGPAWLEQLAFYPLAGAFTLAIAWASWHAFEAPILRLKKRFPYTDIQAMTPP